MVEWDAYASVEQAVDQARVAYVDRRAASGRTPLMFVRWTTLSFM